MTCIPTAYPGRPNQGGWLPRGTALMPAVVLALLLSQPVSAQAPAADLAGFTPGVVQQQVAASLPGLWHLDSESQQSAFNQGNPVDPDIRTRFEAHVSLTADTYAPDGNDGPVVFVRKIAPAGLQKILYGLSQSKLQAGTWTTRLDLQNPEVLNGLGSPLATIPERVVVRGTPEEAAYLKDREAEAQAAQDSKLADVKRQNDLAAQQRAAIASVEDAKRQQAQVAAVAQAQQQAAVDAVAANARRDQAQQDEEAAAKLAQTKAADDQARVQRQVQLDAVQHDMLVAHTKALEELRAALQSTSRTDRLAAIDTALASDDLTVRSLGYDVALGGSDPAAQNVALRRLFDAKRLIVFNLFAPTSWKQNDQSPTTVIGSMGGARLAIREFDLASGRFAGDLLFGNSLQWDAAGSIDRNTMSIVARGPGKPMTLYAAPVSVSFTLQLSPQKELDGFAQVGGSTDSRVTYSPVIVRVNLD